jgi:putative pyruvate formate lyase activating enzyme
MYPIYKSMLENNKLVERVAEADKALHNCHLCGNHCGIDRTERPGPCHISDVACVASYGPHHGEENVLRGWRGSGTIFFAGCNLHCVYCQNYDISQHVVGTPVSATELGSIMLDLETQGCHNINLVSPTHVVPHIVAGLAVAIQAGLRIPVVYNTGGYDAPQALELMDGLVDIYMPDMKYADNDIGKQYSLVKDYATVNQAALREMHRQVGGLQIDEQGLAKRGILVRHLVLPGGLAGTAEIAKFLVEDISPHTYINVMAQYHPAYKAWDSATETHPLNRRTTHEEYRTTVQQVLDAGLQRLDKRLPGLL